MIRFLIPAIILISAGAIGGAEIATAHVTADPPLLRVGLRRDLRGCFSLFDSAGRTLVGRMLGAPRMVRFDTTVVSRWTGRYTGTWRLVQQLGQEEEFQLGAIQMGMIPTWAADSLTDTVRVSFSNGFSGSSYAFEVPRVSTYGALKGRGSSFTDVVAYVDGKREEPQYDRIQVIRHECHRRVAPTQ
jgi:hypothetical protein